VIHYIANINEQCFDFWGNFGSLNAKLVLENLLSRGYVAHWIGWVHRYTSSTIAITNWLTVSQMAMKLSPGT